MKIFTASLLLLLTLTGCSGEVPSKTIKSPNGDYHIELYGRDLGACCTSNSRATIASDRGIFKGLSEQIFEIRGGNSIDISWSDPYSILIIVCNAKSVDFKSDFYSSDLSKYIHVSVINVRPQRDGGKVICVAKPELPTRPV